MIVNQLACIWSQWWSIKNNTRREKKIIIESKIMSCTWFCAVFYFVPSREWERENDFVALKTKIL